MCFFLVIIICLLSAAFYIKNTYDIVLIPENVNEQQTIKNISLYGKNIIQIADAYGYTLEKSKLKRYNNKNIEVSFDLTKNDRYSLLISIINDSRKEWFEVIYTGKCTDEVLFESFDIDLLVRIVNSISGKAINQKDCTAVFKAYTDKEYNNKYEVAERTLDIVGYWSLSYRCSSVPIIETLQISGLTKYGIGRQFDL